ncbi:VOC family protein [Rhodobacteraceae bacterium NNCM2]|nr:VOC family protein [Coraliihabitans acroporae]
MTGPRQFDHIVLVVENLDAAAATYEALGFTLTPRASHPDHMGSANRLAQFGNQTFIELLEIDRPETCRPHGDRFFSFGQHAQDFLLGGEGMAMMVLAGSDAPADAADFAAAGFGDFDPFDFGRKATLPDGTQVEVAFSLAYALPPGLGRSGFFTCHNKFPENFWKPPFQSHANGAGGLVSVYLALEDPAAHGAQIAQIAGSEAVAIEGGVSIACAGGQTMFALTPARIAEITGLDAPAAPGFAGIGIAGLAGDVAPPEGAHGIFLLPQS